MTNTYKVIQIGSQMEYLVGTVQAENEEEALYTANDEFGDKEDADCKLRVEIAE